MKTIFVDYDFVDREKAFSKFEKVENYIKKNNISNSCIIFLNLLEPFHEDQNCNYLEAKNKLDIFLDNINSKVYILFGSKPYDEQRFNSKNIHLIFCEVSLLIYSFLFLEKNTNKKIDLINIKNNFTHLFLSLNRNPKEHRCLLIDNLCKSNLLNKGIYSWNAKTNSKSFNQEKFNFKCFDDEIKRLDLDNYTKDNDGYLTNNILNQKCFVNIVTETLYEDDYSIYVSEKTFYNYLVKQPFIILGCKNQNHYTKKFGFELYDEIFDYSFDFSNDIEKRVDGILQNIKSIENSKLSRLYKKIEDKLNFNKKRALEIIENKLFIPDELKIIYNYNKSILLNDHKLNKFSEFFKIYE